MAKKTGKGSGKKVQQFLYNYLAGGIDPYDFPQYMLKQWGEEIGREIDDDTYPSDLNAKDIEGFRKWLVDNEKGIEFVEKDPYGSPAYLTLNEAKKMPTGTWGIHFTNKSPFESFDYGATLEGLHLSTWNQQKVGADCSKNLDVEKMSAYEHVFFFAFEALGGGAGLRHSVAVIRQGVGKYGRNAVLFQTDAAVRAWHIGDEEHQLIVPACSEYNVVGIVDVDPSSLRCLYEGSEDEGADFESLEALIAYIESEPTSKSRRLARLNCQG
jgi:hypothetical protein